MNHKKIIEFLEHISRTIGGIEILPSEHDQAHGDWVYGPDHVIDVLEAEISGFIAALEATEAE